MDLIYFVTFCLDICMEQSSAAFPVSVDALYVRSFKQMDFFKVQFERIFVVLINIY